MSHGARQLIFLMLFRLTRSFSAGIIILVFPYYVLENLHYSASVLGLLYMAATLSTAGFALLFGFLTDLWGRKGTLFLAGVLLPAGAFLVFASARLPMLFIGAMLGGFSATGSRAAGSVGGAAQPIQSAVIAEFTTLHNRTFWFSVFTFLSGVIGGAGMLAARLFDARDAILWAAVISAAGLVFLAFVNPVDNPGELGRLKSRIVIGKFSLTAAVNGLSQGLIMPFLIPFFALVYHTPQAKMSLYGFGSEMVAAVAILLAPAVEKRLGFVKGIALTRGIGAVLLLLLPLTRIFTLALIVYLFTPALRILAVPVQQTALTAMVNETEMGRALAMNQVARLATSAGAVAFTGYMFDLSEIALPFYGYVVLTCLSVSLYFRFFGAKPELSPE
ncbi:MAG TPA: MFS transporter [Candidatus Acidoferrales bacterium]|nr:MFS transporter [Candidatus Acidoferrales bacterium]